MFKIWKLATLFALIATHPSKIQASLGLAPQTLMNDDSTLPPSPYVDDAFSQKELESMAPEYQYPSPAYAPEINKDDEFPYADNPSIYNPPATYIDDQAPELEDDVGEDEVLYSPSESPIRISPSELDSGIVSDDYYDMAPQVETHAPLLPFNYSAQDDDYIDEQDYAEERKKNGSGIGYFVLGAVSLLGLGGLAYKKTRDHNRKHYHMYQLAKC